MSASSASLFLSIYASNALIRSLFFPLSTAAFLVPFGLVALIYGPLNVSILDSIELHPTIKTVTLQLTVAILASIIATRVLSSWFFGITNNDFGEIRPVATLPYWVPGLQHIVSTVLGGSEWWKKKRDKSKHPIFALSIGGIKHNIIVSPHLSRGVQKAIPSGSSSSLVRRTLLTNAFGLKSNHESIFQLQVEFSEQLKSSDFCKILIGRMEQDLPNLISFMPTAIDQMAWERTASVDVTEHDGSSGVAETFLSSIVREYLGYSIASALLGSSFANNYSNLAKDLETFNSSIYSIGTGLPRWFPIPGIVTAYAVRRRLLAHLYVFHNALDISLAGESVIQTYGDLSDVSPLFLSLVESAKERGITPEDQPKLTLALLWHLTSTIGGASFWLLYHLLYDARAAFDEESSVLHALRKESAPHANALQPAATLGIAEPPSLRLSPGPLIDKSRLAQACLLETLRVNYSSWRIIQLTHDIDVSESTEDTPSTDARDAPIADSVTWRLRKGEWVHLAGALYHSSPTYFTNPLAWQPGLHTIHKPHSKLSEPQSTVQGAQMSTVRWNAMGGSDWSDHKALIEISLAFVAGVVALWDVELPDGKEIKAGVRPGQWSGQGGDVRVRFRRRPLSSG